MGYTYLQNYALQLLNTGENVFISGGAGTGKTFIIKDYIRQSQDKGMNVMICAPTGVAALNLDGATIHHQFNIGNQPVIRCNKIKFISNDELVNTDILIIDEISMCRVDLFDFISNHILIANSVRKAKGKRIIQFIVVGDFFQLPPVIKGTEKYMLDSYYGFDIGLGFPFYSTFWEMFKFKTVILTEVIRQSETEFITNLNKLRVGDKSVIDYFYEKSNSLEISDAISLFGKNSDVDEKNTKELETLPGESKIYHADITGKASIDDILAPEHLELKLNCRVMALANRDSHVNGSLGTVVGLYDNSVIVAWDNGYTEEIEPYTWSIKRYDLDTDSDNIKYLHLENIGEITQIPLKLAYAITIHKSQGQTYDKVNISPYTWDCGQLYVALSRAKSIENLHLNYRIEPNYSKTSLNVIRFYNSIIDETNQDIDISNNKEKYTIERKSKYINDMNNITNKLKLL